MLHSASRIGRTDVHGFIAQRDQLHFGAGGLGHLEEPGFHSPRFFQLLEKLGVMHGRRLGGHGRQEREDRPGENVVFG